MRARQRHFNPRFAGFTAVFDARFLDLTNNSSVSTWLDRSGSDNNATNSGSARPVFKTNQINGQPSVEFTTSGASKLLLTSSISVSATSESLIVSKKSGNYMIGLCNSSFFSRGYNFLDYNDGNVYATNSTNGAGGYCANNGTTASIWYIGLNQIAYLNGAALSVTALGAVGSSFSANNMGSRSTEYSDGVLGLVCYCPTALTNALRKRLQQSAAFAFKIACS